MPLEPTGPIGGPLLAIASHRSLRENLREILGSERRIEGVLDRCGPDGRFLGSHALTGADPSPTAVSRDARCRVRTSDILLVRQALYR